MKTNLIIRWGFIFGLVLLAFGCNDPRDLGWGYDYPLDKTVVDDVEYFITSDQIVNAKPFVFYYWEGIIYSYGTLSLDSDGHVIYLFSTQEVHKSDDQIVGVESIWKRTEFDVDDAVVNDLALLLADISFLELEKGYLSKAVDGTMCNVMLSIDSQEKLVYWYNCFPDNIQRIHGFVQDRILAGHEQEISQAKVIKWPEMTEDIFNEVRPQEK